MEVAALKLQHFLVRPWDAAHQANKRGQTKRLAKVATAVSLKDNRSCHLWRSYSVPGTPLPLSPFFVVVVLQPCKVNIIIYILQKGQVRFIAVK